MQVWKSWALRALCLIASLVVHQTTAMAEEHWKGQQRSVAYLPALDVAAGGGFAQEGGRWGLLARVSAGVHRLTSDTLLTLGPEGARETGRYVMGLGGQWVHLRAGFGVDVAALRDITAERWGFRGGLVASYLNAGVSVYEGGTRAYMLSLRVPLSLLVAWGFGWL